MKMPEYMNLTTCNMMVQGVKDLLNTADPIERETQAGAIGLIADDMFNNFFGFLESYLQTLAIISMVRGVHPSSQDIQRSIVLLKEVAYEFGEGNGQNYPLKHLRFGEISDSFIRLCKELPRVEFSINNKDDYEITFDNDIIKIG